MKFNVTKEKLLEGLQQVQNVVSTRTTLPILSNVLLQANGKDVHLTTTDLDVGVRGSFEAEVEKEGATTLPARRLFNIIRELPSSGIQIDVDGKNCAMACVKLRMPFRRTRPVTCSMASFLVSRTTNSPLSPRMGAGLRCWTSNWNSRAVMKPTSSSRRKRSRSYSGCLPTTAT